MLGIIESPFSAPTPEGVERNRRYLAACIRHVRLTRGCVPWASHAILPLGLSDTVQAERESGMTCTKELLSMLANARADAVCFVFVDLGISRGMQWGIETCARYGMRVEFIELGEDWESTLPDLTHHTGEA